MDRKIIGVIVIFLIVTLTGFTSNTYAKFEKNVIVQYSSMEGKQAVLSSATEVLLDLEQLQMLSIKIADEKMDQLKSHPEIILIEENQTFSIQQQFKVASNSSSEKDLWNLKAINANNAWAEGITGKGIKIAIIDSGVSKHPDLNITDGVSFVGDHYNDGHGHGTHIAGIIAAQHNDFGVAGVAPNAEIYVVKAIEDDGFGGVDKIIQGIDWAINKKMDLINLSFGDLESSVALHEAIRLAKQKGILIVAASGNEGTDQGIGNTMIYPARHEEVIAVSSVNQSFQRSTFSSTGAANDFAAPGEEIYSTYLNGGYATYQGTSLAAPHIVGLLALLMQQYAYLTADELYEGLKLYAEDLGTVGFDEWYGFGMPKYQTITQSTKLFSLNESNKQAIEQAVQAFNQKPTAIQFTSIMDKLNQVRDKAFRDQKQKEMEKAVAILSKSAEKVLVTFERSPTKYNYTKASEALQSLPETATKVTLDERLQAGLLVLAKPAIEKLERYENSKTKSNYSQAKLAIQRLPKSPLKSELQVRLNQS